jgi:predicted enzyme related to lactoylglutathione lyase
MKKSICLAALALACITPHVHAQQTPTGAPIVFFDIAGPEPTKLTEFYKTVFGWTIGASGNMTVSVTPPLSGTFRKEPAEKILYIGVEDITATLAKVTANGGTIDTPRFEVKGVVILGLFRDPAGNRMGLVEMAGGKAEVP